MSHPVSVALEMWNFKSQVLMMGSELSQSCTYAKMHPWMKINSNIGCVPSCFLFQSWTFGSKSQKIATTEYDFVPGVTLWCNIWSWADLFRPPDLECWQGSCTYITSFVHFFSMSKCLSFFVGHIFDQKMFTCAQYLCCYWQNQIPSSSLWDVNICMT